MKTCFGCHNKFRPAEGLPEAPGDLVIVSQMLRSYKKDKQEQNGAVSPVYFHVNTKCIAKLDPDFVPADIIIADEKKKAFQSVHKKFLKQFTGKKV